MAGMTVAAIRQKIADNPHREDWYPIRRMSDEELGKAIVAGFSWIAAMDNPYDPEAPFDLADVTDAQVEAFANSLGLPPDGEPSA
ncbi:hypothetical protein LP421_16935 [Rhizobium sp. RCAM05350]|nr:hypothetical protein LP421_16935 [Rhizobium sp. RCAM05350]